ncbi:Alpha/Beta hydrolase protein [Blastocladiella britannica]|nr:Alpha/Beta hydrolase protein [Blastocladiella britannica]
MSSGPRTRGRGRVIFPFVLYAIINFLLRCYKTGKMTAASASLLHRALGHLRSARNLHASRLSAVHHPPTTSSAPGGVARTAAPPQPGVRRSLHGPLLVFLAYLHSKWQSTAAADPVPLVAPGGGAVSVAEPLGMVARMPSVAAAAGNRPPAAPPSHGTQPLSVPVEPPAVDVEEPNSQLPSTSSSAAATTRTTPKTTTTAITMAEYRIATHYQPPMHPIVLCHGLFGFDETQFLRLRIEYWRGIVDALRGIGCDVYVARVPSADNIHARALALYRFLQKSQIQHANLVCHSMGGLDARYLLSQVGLPAGTKIHSLTTVSTPHRGSPMMDWFASVFGVSKNLGSFETPEHLAHLQQQHSNGEHPFVERLRRYDPHANHPLSGVVQTLGLDFPAYACLTTWHAKLFNEQVPDVPDTSYLSYGASAPDLPIYAPLRIPYEIVKRAQGHNDGLVSLDSARWGLYLGTLPCDHYALTNRFVSARLYQNFDAPGFYVEHASRLSRMGY